MNDEQSQKYIPCREFYGTVACISMMVGILALDIMRYAVVDSLLSALYSIPDFLVAFFALGIGLVYSIKYGSSKRGR
jgi:hypothetical protein